MVGHPVKSRLHKPAEQQVDERTSGQAILYAVGQICFAVGTLELVPGKPEQ